MQSTYSMLKKAAILYICFLFIETLVCMVLAIIFSLSQDFISLERFIFNTVNVPIGLSLIRFIYCSLPLVLIFLILFKYVYRLDVQYKPVLFSVFNLSVFVGLNLLCSLLKGLPTVEFTEPLFVLIALPIFLSPLILGQLPYARRLMDTLL